MSSSRHIQPSSSFEASSTFNFPNSSEGFRASVKLTDSGLVETWLHDFRVTFKPAQAHLVAATLVQAAVNLSVGLTGGYSKAVEFHDYMFLWVGLMRPTLSLPRDDLE